MFYEEMIDSARSDKGCVMPGVVALRLRSERQKDYVMPSEVEA